MRKICSTCKKNKSTKYFHKDSFRNDGYRNRCKECCAKTYKNWYSKNKTKKIKQKRKYYYDNHQWYLSLARKYYRKNKTQINKIENQRKKRRRFTDYNFRILCSLRSRICKILKGKIKNETTKEFIGCSIEELRIHIERQFTKGMTWKNYGIRGWHIDHIKPCCSFDLTDPAQQKICFHYTNLQPLWAIDNLKKGKKY